MECRLETITPKKAAAMLKLNTKNRPLSMKAVDRLASAMQRGEWKLNGDTIKMNGEVLIDGQHRLNAIVKSGVACPMYVVKGVQSDAFDTLDQGRRRTGGDMFARDGEKHYNSLACACRYIHMYKTGAMRGKSKSEVTPIMLRQVLDASVGLRDSVQFVSDLKASDYMSVGMASTLHWLFSEKDDDLASQFFSQLCTGEDINRDMPVYSLRQRLIRNRGEQAKLNQITIAAFTIKAWNATRKNEKLGQIKWVDNEDFPTVK